MTAHTASSRNASNAANPFLRALLRLLALAALGGMFLYSKTISVLAKAAMKAIRAAAKKPEAKPRDDERLEP